MISVIIPNLNSPIIGQTINSLLCQNTALPFEIVVVGMDKFGIIEQINDERVKFLRTDKPTPPSIARNIGANAACGDFIVFIDADCIADENFLEQHIEAHRINQNSLIGGAVRLSAEKKYWILADNVSTFHEILLHTKPGIREILPSLNLSIPKQLWNEIGGFDPTFPTAAGEDADLSYRARKFGIKVHFTKNAIVEHRHQRGSLKALLIHAFNFGRFSLKFNPKYEPYSTLSKLINDYPILLIIFSPVLACKVIVKILFNERLPFRYWHVLPAVFLSKMAWCFGARKRIIKGK